MIKTFYILAIILFFGLGVTAQQTKPNHYRLIVSLENAPFDSLIAHDYTREEAVLFYGEKVSEYSWIFDIPDSIALISERLILMSSFYNPIDSSSTMIRFISPYQDLLPVVNIGFQDSINYISAVYKESTVIEHTPLQVEINKVDSTIIGKLILKDFDLVVSDDHSDISVRAHDPLFAWFQSAKADRSYENYIAHYLSVAERFPNSRYLLTYLSDNLMNFRSKADVKKIYELLSDKFGETHWANKIKMYLDDKVQNAILFNGTNGQFENVIQDSSKHNLLIFSASWCIPCIEEIPLLKAIYSDLGDDLIMTFVSVDREKDVNAFQRIVADHEVPWRTLYAYHDIQRVNDQYAVETIPHVILVSPNLSFQFLDVRNDADREILYNLLAK